LARRDNIKENKNIKNNQDKVSQNHSKSPFKKYFKNLFDHSANEQSPK